MSKSNKLLQLLSCIDLTSLEATDNHSTIQQLVEKANRGFNDRKPAAICVYPNFGEQVALTADKKIKTAVVAGYFPSGQTFPEAKIAELRAIANTPVQEVDVVISRGRILEGNYAFLKEELLSMRKVIPSMKLKVILETGELKTAEMIRNTSEICIQCGADFIKTSTGKSAIGATPEAVEIMCQVIRNTFDKTGKKIGIKPSGGIKTIEDALVYMNIVERINGSEWLKPETFRIGASSLYDAVISALHDGNNT